MLSLQIILANRHSLSGTTVRIMPLVFVLSVQHNTWLFSSVTEVRLSGSPEGPVVLDGASPAPAIGARRLKLAGAKPDSRSTPGAQVDDVRVQLGDNELLLPLVPHFYQEGSPADAGTVACGGRGPRHQRGVEVKEVAGSYFRPSFPARLTG